MLKTNLHIKVNVKSNRQDTRRIYATESFGDNSVHQPRYTRPPLAGPRYFPDEALSYITLIFCILRAAQTIYAPNHRSAFKTSSVKLDAGFCCSLLRNETHLVGLLSTWVVFATMKRLIVYRTTR